MKIERLALTSKDKNMTRRDSDLYIFLDFENYDLVLLMTLKVLLVT